MGSSNLLTASSILPNSQIQSWLPSLEPRASAPIFSWSSCWAAITIRTDTAPQWTSLQVQESMYMRITPTIPVPSLKKADSISTYWVSFCIYMDPLASLFVGFMIIGTALPLTLRSGRMLAEAAPKDIDLKGVRKDVAAVEGVEGVHELHVWSLSQSKAIAALHLTVASDSLTAFMALSRKIQSCLHYWGLHAVTIQPEFVGAAVARNDENDEVSAIPPPRRPSSLDAEASACRMRCPSQLCDEACC